MGAKTKKISSIKKYSYNIVDKYFIQLTAEDIAFSTEQSQWEGFKLKKR